MLASYREISTKFDIWIQKSEMLWYQGYTNDMGSKGMWDSGTMGNGECII